MNAASNRKLRQSFMMPVDEIEDAWWSLLVGHTYQYWLKFCEDVNE